MSSPIFDRLSSASTSLVQAKERSIDDFSKEASRLALVVEEVFHEQIQRRGDHPNIRIARAYHQEDSSIEDNYMNHEATGVRDNPLMARGIRPLEEGDQFSDPYEFRDVTAVEEASNEDPPSEPNLWQRVFNFVLEFFQESSDEEPRLPVVSMDPMLVRLAASVIPESRTVIVGKLFEYSQNGENRIVSFDQDKKDQVLGYLEEIIQGAPVDIPSRTMNTLIEKLKDKTQENNNLDWNKVLDVVESLHRILEASKPT